MSRKPSLCVNGEIWRELLVSDSNDARGKPKEASLTHMNALPRRKSLGAYEVA